MGAFERDTVEQDEAFRGIHEFGSALHAVEHGIERVFDRVGGGCGDFALEPLLGSRPIIGGNGVDCAANGDCRTVSARGASRRRRGFAALSREWLSGVEEEQRK